MSHPFKQFWIPSSSFGGHLLDQWNSTFIHEKWECSRRQACSLACFVSSRVCVQVSSWDGRVWPGVQCAVCKCVERGRFACSHVSSSPAPTSPALLATVFDLRSAWLCIFVQTRQQRRCFDSKGRLLRQGGAVAEPEGGGWVGWGHATLPIPEQRSDILQGNHQQHFTQTLGPMRHIML